MINFNALQKPTPFCTKIKILIHTKERYLNLFLTKFPDCSSSESLCSSSTSSSHLSSENYQDYFVNKHPPKSPSTLIIKIFTVQVYQMVGSCLNYPKLHYPIQTRNCKYMSRKGELYDELVSW